MSKTTKLRFECVVDQNCIMKHKDGKLILVFFHEVQDLDPNDEDEMGEIQSNLLWECFDSSLEVVRTYNDDLEESDEVELTRAHLQLVASHHDNVEGKELFFAIPVEMMTEDDGEAIWNWADHQSVATINHVEYRSGSICITPQWTEDLTHECLQAWEEDFYDHFAERFQDPLEVINPVVNFTKYTFLDD